LLIIELLTEPCAQWRFQGSLLIGVLCLTGSFAKGNRVLDGI
jgi:hypothetical protein